MRSICPSCFNARGILRLAVGARERLCEKVEEIHWHGAQDVHAHISSEKMDRLMFERKELHGRCASAFFLCHHALSARRVGWEEDTGKRTGIKMENEGRKKKTLREKICVIARVAECGFGPTL